MNRTWLLRAGGAALLLALVALVVNQTEWVDEKEPQPARGAAVADPHYALGVLVSRVGATLERHANLETLPPRGTTLLLENTAWDLFPERQARLRAWVEQGGDLVIEEVQLMSDDLRAWVPLRLDDPATAPASCPAPGASAASSAASSAGRAGPGDRAAMDEDPDEDEDDEDRAGDAAPARPPRAASSSRSTVPTDRLGRALCTTFTDASPAGRPAALPWRSTYRVCEGPPRAYERVWTAGGVVPSWSLVTTGERVAALRVPVGAGTVTVHQLAPILTNARLPFADHAAAAAAVLRLHPGQVVWVVDDESQPALPLWIWQHAPAAVLLGALALAAWLWRRMVRFGPPVAEPERARRSIGEQVRGTADFLRRHEPAALHRATRRALDERARRHIAGYDALEDDAARLQAVARAAGVPPGPLVAAAHLPADASPAACLAAVATLEQARRALRAAPGSRATTAPDVAAAPSAPPSPPRP